MKKFLYLFICVLSQALFSQKTEPVGKTPETKAIDKQLEEIHQKTKSFIDPKYEAPLLQLKSQSQKLGYDDGVLRSGDYLMGLYVGIENDKKAAELATELKKIAENKRDDYGHISSIYRRSGLTLGYLGLSDASLKDFQQAIKHAEKIKNSDKKGRLLAFAYNNINVYYYNKIKEPGAIDSIHSNFKKSLEIAKRISDNDNVVSVHEKYELIADIYMQTAILYLDHKNYNNRLQLAEKNLFEILKIYDNKRLKQDPINKARTYNELSKLYIQKNEPEKAILYGKQALQFEKQHSGPFVRLQSFKALLEAYLEIGDTENSKLFKNKHTILQDSLNYEERKAANTTMKKLVAEADSEHKESSKKQWIITGIIALSAAIAIIIYWRRRNKILRKNYEHMIDKLKKEQSTQTLSTDVYNEEIEVPSETEIDDEQSYSLNKNVISSQTEARILKRLETFEKSEKFLRKDLTVSLLASQLKTNSKYLSEIIKNNKSLSFSDYINNLKINYIVHKLYNEPKYRGYKISYLAEASGYASSQVFVLAFKKINGVTPSYFIQNLNDEHV